MINTVLKILYFLRNTPMFATLLPMVRVKLIVDLASIHLKVSTTLAFKRHGTYQRNNSDV